MWTPGLTRLVPCSLDMPALSIGCGGPGSALDSPRFLPEPPTRPTPNYPACAYNSRRASSTRSLNVRSRDICLSTLFTLWITVE